MQMKNRLKENYIDFIILDRVGIDNENENIISATKVRKLLQDRNFEEMQKYVTKTRLQFLEENY